MTSATGARAAESGEAMPQPEVETDTAAHPEGERLQKVIAAAGVASRRTAEEMIADGRVTVDGEVVSRMGTRVHPTTAVIHVDGERLVLDPGLVHLALNKPPGVITAMSDDRGRRTVGDLVAEMPDELFAEAPEGARTRVFHVGRLDAESEGLLLLTNDGDLTHRLTHPSFGLEKTYLAEVPGPVRPATLRRLKTGVPIDGRPVTVHKARVVQAVARRALVEVVVHEGRKHVVRRLLAEVGHPVARLVRTRIGPIPLDPLPPGKARRLTRKEVGGLYAAAGL
jgi:23S rRNA pseudouridine2605 synthase